MTKMKTKEEMIKEIEKLEKQNGIFKRENSELKNEVRYLKEKINQAHKLFIECKQLIEKPTEK